MQSLRVQPRPIESDPLILGPSNLCCNKPPRLWLKLHILCLLILNTRPGFIWMQTTPLPIGFHGGSSVLFLFALTENAGAIRLSLDQSGAPGRAADAVRKVKRSESHSVVSDSLQPHGLYSPWNSPGLNAGVVSLSLPQGIFPTQGSNPGLPHCRWILYRLSHKGAAKDLDIDIRA